MSAYPIYIDDVVNCFQNCIFTYNSQLEMIKETERRVVNCFQNCIFTYNSQLGVPPFAAMSGCELLSKLYFYL